MKMTSGVWLISVLVFFCIADKTTGTQPCTGLNDTQTIDVKDSVNKGDVVYEFETNITSSSESDCWNYFAMNGTTMYLNNSFLNTSDCNYYVGGECKYVCKSQEGLGLTYSFLITRSNVPIVSPEFKSKNYSFTIKETSNIGTVLKDFHNEIKWKDCYKKGTDTIYKIIGSSSNNFVIGGMCLYGDLCLNGPLDYEKQDSYSFILEAQHDNNSTRSWNTTVTIHIEDVDDMDPAFSQPIYNLDVTEKNYSVLNVFLDTEPPIHAHDIDTGKGRQNITYSINTTTGHFAIDENSGQIKITNSLDYESQHIYFIQIKAVQDNNDMRSAVATLVVNVLDANDNPPTFPTEGYSTEINENLHTGDLVLTVTATDKDTEANSKNIYKLLNNTGVFTIGNETGTIRVRDSTKLDREIQELYYVLVEAVDEMNISLSDTTVVEIVLRDINDNSPVFDQTAYHFIVNGSEFTATAKVYATDDDDDDNGLVQYSISNITSHNGITVNTTTGALSLSISLLDDIRVFVEACDQPQMINTRRCTLVPVHITIYENDTMDISNMYSTSIMENAPVGSIAGYIRVPGAISFSMTTSVAFDVGLHSGVIRSLVTLDREHQQSYNFTVLVTGGKLSTNISVNIEVLDANDNAPHFPKPTYTMDRGSLETRVNTNAPPSTFVTATDIDDGENGMISYSLQSNSGSDYSVDSYTGQIMKSSGSNIMSGMPTLIVVAHDNGTPRLQSFCTVHITSTRILGTDTVEIPTPLTPTDLAKKLNELEIKIGNILNLTIHSNAVPPKSRESNNYLRSYLQVRAEYRNKTSVPADDLQRSIILHMGEIEALFTQQTTVSKYAGDDTNAEEIALIVIAVVIFVSLVSSIIFLFVRWKREKEESKMNRLRKNLTRTSSLYESQEIKTTLDIEDDNSMYNESVTNHFENGIPTKLPPDSFAFDNPVYHGDEETLVKQSAHDGSGVFNEALSSLDALSERLDEEDSNGVPESHDFVSQPSQEESAISSNAYESIKSSHHAGYSKVKNQYEDMEFVNIYDSASGLQQPATSPNDNENVAPTNPSHHEKNSEKDSKDVDIENGEQVFSLTGMDISTNDGTKQRLLGVSDKDNMNNDVSEPDPDYEQKQVRFSTQVVDTATNKIEDLKQDKSEANDTNPEGLNGDSEHDEEDDDNEFLRTNFVTRGSFDRIDTDASFDPLESDKVDEEINSPLDFLRGDAHFMEESVQEGSFSFHLQEEETTPL